MEKPLYYDQLAALVEVFGDVAVISRAKAARYLGVDPRTLDKTKGFPMKKIGRHRCVPLVGLARWLS